QLPHGEIAPLPLFADIVNLQTSLPANPAAQKPPAEPIDVHQHALVGLFHFGHGMSFQTQLFSDKGFYEHLGSGPFVFFDRNNENNPIPGCLSNPHQTATPSVQRASTPITLFGEEPLWVKCPAAAAAGARRESVNVNKT